MTPPIDDHTRKILMTILSDAHVVDLDISEWDRHIALVVVADHIKPRGHSRSIFLLRFVRPTHFSIDYVNPVEIPEDKSYCQWNLHDFRFAKANGFEDWTLISARPGPNLRIVFKTVSVVEMRREVL